MSNEINDGGPAFPGDSQQTGPWFGMALRDWFAGQALTGLCFGRREDVSTFASEAYNVADAMLKARGAHRLLADELADAERACENWRALCAFLLTADDPMDFLRCWNEGDFDTCRREWPEAPDEVYPKGT